MRFAGGKSGGLTGCGGSRFARSFACGEPDKQGLSLQYIRYGSGDRAGCGEADKHGLSLRKIDPFPRIGRALGERPYILNRR